jgi:hypothetical protein
MRKTFVPLLVLGALLACRHIDPWTHEYNLEQAQLAYTQSMRWGQFDKASLWISPDDRARFFREAQALRDVRISEYEIGELEMGDGGTSATVRVSYRVYDMRTLIEREVRETQEWSFDDDRNRWQVRSQIASLRDGTALPRESTP